MFKCPRHWCQVSSVSDDFCVDSEEILQSCYLSSRTKYSPQIFSATFYVPVGIDHQCLVLFKYYFVIIVRNLFDWYQMHKSDTCNASFKRILFLTWNIRPMTLLFWLLFASNMICHINHSVLRIANNCEVFYFLAKVWSNATIQVSFSFDFQLLGFFSMILRRHAN